MEPPTTRLEDYDPTSEQMMWEEFWSQEIKPGEFFDKAKPLPEFIKQLSDGSLPNIGTALVPGCGRGYDVELLCRAGYNATGLDISPTGVSAAREYLESVSTPGEYRMVCGDFFAAPLGVFDLVYDYTFFCALRPEIRVAYGKRMAELVRKEGMLITAAYPLHKSPEEGGPPYGVSEEVYREVLGDYFVPVDGFRVLDTASSHPDRGDGRTGWCRWKRV